MFAWVPRSECRSHEGRCQAGLRARDFEFYVYWCENQNFSIHNPDAYCSICDAIEGIFLAFLASSAIKNGIAEVAKKKQLSWVMFSHICAKHLLSKDFIVQIYPNGKMLKYASTRTRSLLAGGPSDLWPSSFAPFGHSSRVTHADESSSI